MAQLKPKTRDELQALVSGAVQDAVDFIESDIAPDRIKAQQYFDGGVDIGQEEGRSKVVATKVRDTIRQVKPSLMRIFLSHEKPVEFVPEGPRTWLPPTRRRATCRSAWSSPTASAS